MSNTDGTSDAAPTSAAGAPSKTAATPTATAPTPAAISDAQVEQASSTRTRDFDNYQFDPACMFRDGIRQIDYVIAYQKIVNETEEKKAGEQERSEKRAYFEENLKKMGLELEHAELGSTKGVIGFTLIHASVPALEREAIVGNVHLPYREMDCLSVDERKSWLDRIIENRSTLTIKPEGREVLHGKDYFRKLYDPEHRSDFVNGDKLGILFPSSERSLMVYEMLNRAAFEPEGSNPVNFGIESLLASNVYNSAYPLHHSCRNRENIAIGDERNHREALRKHWASMKSILKQQPLDAIKSYFGTKIGIYFCWLGFYTMTLIPPAIGGILIMIISAATVSSDPISHDVCNSTGDHNSIIICPPCNDLRYCDFLQIKSQCTSATIGHVFDNLATVFFAILMSLWASFFLEGWKRYNSEIAWKWGLSEELFDVEVVRPEFQAKVTTKKMNPATKKMESYLTTKKKVANLVVVGVTILFFCTLVMGMCISVICYKVVISRLLSTELHKLYGAMFKGVSAGVLNLALISILNGIYRKIARILTKWECPRTQEEFDNSYTVKVFLFQFVNIFSIMFYIAFFKDLTSDQPQMRQEERGFEIFGYTLDSCPYNGCFNELVMQMAIILCGKQFFSGIIENLLPIIKGLIRKWRFGENLDLQKALNDEKSGNAKRWESDYYLSPSDDTSLFGEYLEMVIQFAFCTMFVSAFPLAPFFCLLNNLMEIRTDAKKFLKDTQRQIPLKASNIGVWYTILNALSRISVTMNGLVIAFTSDFVPRFVFHLQTGSLDDYLDWSLAYYSLHDIDTSISKFENVTHCRYRGLHMAPCSLNITIPAFLDKNQPCDDMMGPSATWYRVTMARLLFFVIFEHVIIVFKQVLEYIIPDVPSRIFVQQQRHKYLMREIVKKGAEKKVATSTKERLSQKKEVEKPATDPATNTVTKQQPEEGPKSTQPDNSDMKEQ